ncbi:hypothetical protein [Oceanobacillus massiliensis]|uniref:hypothetical protein n=1 Tax=Oceanobacillus massiliensis TaxID=1465765 RepID=UPI003016726D
MNLSKNDMYYLDASQLRYGIDFDVITETPFTEGIVERLYGVDNHVINDKWIKKLGLGVVKNNYTNDSYIYDITSENILNETVKIGIYYQLTHPEFDDKELDRWVFGSKEGVDYVIGLLGNEAAACVLSQLKEIFKAKKGKVLAFKKC